LLGKDTVRIGDTVKSVRELTKRLDKTNIKILSAMWRFGPRNLLEISRRTGIPFTSVYHRAAKLEARSGRIAYLIPRLSRMGMIRVAVFVAANSGFEDQITAALKIPNLWRSLNLCEGAFTNHSIHAVPVRYLKEFRTYLRQLVKMRLASKCEVITTGEQYPNFPNFRYYSPETTQWMFPWGQWLKAVRKITPSQNIEDPKRYPTLVDKKDLLIVKELEKNARRRFADLAPMLGMTLQGVKHRFDKRLVPNGLVWKFAFDIIPYPLEVSAYHEIMLDFTSNQAMQKFFALRNELFFVVGTSKVIGRNSLLVRTCIIQSQVQNMFMFFSEMAKARMLQSFSPLRLSLTGRQTQTISYELFDDEKGWVVDFRRCTSKLRKLVEHGRLLKQTLRTK